MVELLRMLLPRKELKGEYIFHTLQEVNEIFFIEKGAVNIGFEINRGSKFIVRLSKGGVMGGYNCTFNKKTMFVYQVQTDFEGQTLKKLQWKSILQNPDYAVLTNCLKLNMEAEYMRTIKKKIVYEK